MDFTVDALATKRRIDILTVADDCIKEAIELVADLGVSGHYVPSIVDHAAGFAVTPRPSGLTGDPNPRAKLLVIGPMHIVFSSSRSSPESPRRMPTLGVSMENFGTNA